MDLLRLIRYKNLLLILLIQLLMVGAIIAPLLASYGMSTDVPFPELAVLLFSTLLLAAGGYSINDYFDHQTDRINQPKRVIPANKMNLSQVLKIYRYLTISALLFGFLLAWMLKSLSWALFFPAIAALLWYYSAKLKRMPLLGNILVAALSALSIFSTAWVTVTHLQLNYHDLLYETSIPGELFRLISFFAVFAFLLNLIRELVKDAEDIEGDKLTGCSTLPVVAGLTITRYLCLALLMLSLLIIWWFLYSIIPYTHWSGAFYLLVSTVLPLIWLGFLIIKARQPGEFRKASDVLKVLMVSGSAYALVWLLNFNNHFPII